MRLDLWSSHSAMATVREIREERIKQLRDTYQQKADAPIPDAQHLPGEVVGERRAEQRKAARDRATTAINRVESDLDDAIATIRGNARDAFAPPTDPTAAMLAEQRQTRAWNRAQTLLNSGRTAHQIIHNAPDIDTIEALRAELPTWITAQSPVRATTILGGDNPDDRDFQPLMRTLDQRLTELVTDDRRGFLNVRLAADALEPGARALIRGFRNELDGHGNPMGTQIEAHYADAEAARTIPDPNTQTDTNTTAQGRAPQSLRSATNAHYNTGNDAA